MALPVLVSSRIETRESGIPGVTTAFVWRSPAGVGMVKLPSCVICDDAPVAVSVCLLVGVMLAKWSGVCVGWAALSKMNLVVPGLVSPWCDMSVDCESSCCVFGVWCGAGVHWRDLLVGGVL